MGINRRGGALASSKTLAEFYRKLRLIRRVEESIVEIYPSDKIKSPVHLSIGQEAVSVGICAAVKGKGQAYGTYRSHALYLAMEGSLNEMMAELYGKIDGCGTGRAGSMHLACPEAGLIASSAVVATTIPTAVGHAFADKSLGRNKITAVFFGEGAMDEGVVAESLNFASLKKLPVIFICENNRYAIHSKTEDRRTIDDLAALPKACGVRSVKMESDDVEGLYEKTAAEVDDALAGAGPCFIEVPTQRWLEHVGPREDFNLGYRQQAEVEGAQAADQMLVLRKRLAEEVALEIDEAVEKDIAAAIAFAEASPFPPVETLYHHQFA